MGAVGLRLPPDNAVGGFPPGLLHPPSPVPPALTTAGKTVVSVPSVGPSQNFSASSCSILSWAYSVVREARWPWVSVVEVAIVAKPIIPAATTSRIARAIIVSSKLMPASTQHLKQPG